jgi:hypothetical protein
VSSGAERARASVEQSDPDLPYDVPDELRDDEEEALSDLFQKKRKPKRRRIGDEGKEG